MDERRYKINQSDLIIRFGNILQSKTDIIVSSDDSHLTMGGGVSGAILSLGGYQILNDAQKNIPAKLGDVIITSAGSLHQKYIFHCVTINCNIRTQHSIDNSLLQYIIRHSVEKCLRIMSLLDINSIAFPAIGTGATGFDLGGVATGMLDVIIKFLYATNRPYLIELYLYDRSKQKSVMDYMVFFETVSENIYKHKMKNIDCINGSNDTVKTKPNSSIKSLGQMAVKSPTDEHKVFISYSRKNTEQVGILCKQLDDWGISYWIDVEGKYHSRDFKEVLIDAIESSKVVVFLSSKESNESEYVIKELKVAIAAGIDIIPIRIDDSQYAKKLRFDLTDIQWIDYFGDNKDQAIEDFKYTLQLIFRNNSK